MNNTKQNKSVYDIGKMNYMWNTIKLKITINTKNNKKQKNNNFENKEMGNTLILKEDNTIDTSIFIVYNDGNKKLILYKYLKDHYYDRMNGLVVRKIQCNKYIAIGSDYKNNGTLKTLCFSELQKAHSCGYYLLRESLKDYVTQILNGKEEKNAEFVEYDSFNEKCINSKNNINNKNFENNFEENDKNKNNSTGENENNNNNYQEKNNILINKSQIMENLNIDNCINQIINMDTVDIGNTLNNLNNLNTDDNNENNNMIEIRNILKEEIELLNKLKLRLSNRINNINGELIQVKFDFDDNERIIKIKNSQSECSKRKIEKMKVDIESIKKSKHETSQQLENIELELSTLTRNELIEKENENDLKQLLVLMEKNENRNKKLSSAVSMSTFMLDKKIELEEIGNNIQNIKTEKEKKTNELSLQTDNLKNLVYNLEIDTEKLENENYIFSNLLNDLEKYDEIRKSLNEKISILNDTLSYLNLEFKLSEERYNQVSSSSLI